MRPCVVSTLCGCALSYSRSIPSPHYILLVSWRVVWWDFDQSTLHWSRDAAESSLVGAVLPFDTHDINPPNGLLLVRTYSDRT
jgi:hypothetical protein